MAYFYGNETNHWWGYGNVSTSDQSGSVTRVTLTAGMQARGWGFDISYVDATATINGQSSTTYDNDFYSPRGGYDAVDMVTKTLDVTRTHSAQTINVSIKVVNRSSYMDGTSTASSTVTIPARPSYTVSYNANNGSGAPVAQTKWYGETLTLSTTKPTRTGYTFLGWSTSSTATSATYAAGGSYIANSGATLYAVWKRSGNTIHVYNSSGQVKQGIVTVYSSTGTAHSCIITVYDANGKAKSAQ